MTKTPASVTMLIGEPAVGKSRVFREVFRRGSYDFERLPFVHHIDRLEGVCILGSYDDPEAQFPGTDRLGMSVAHRAYGFIEAHPNVSFLLEGARLGTGRFCEEILLMGRELRVGWVTCEAWELAARRALEREQRPSYVQGMRTRCRNLAMRFPSIVTPFDCSMPDDVGTIADWVLSRT